MSNKGDKLKERLAEFVSNQSEKPSKKEFEAAVKTVFNEKKKKEKSEKDISNTGEKTKRKPSSYNMFYAEQSSILKQKESEDGGEKMTAKAKMQYIAALWKEKNGKDAEPEEDNE